MFLCFIKSMEKGWKSVWYDPYRYFCWFFVKTFNFLSQFSNFLQKSTKELLLSLKSCLWFLTYRLLLLHWKSCIIKVFFSKEVFCSLPWVCCQKSFLLEKLSLKLNISTKFFLRAFLKMFWFIYSLRLLPQIHLCDWSKYWTQKILKERLLLMYLQHRTSYWKILRHIYQWFGIFLLTKFPGAPSWSIVCPFWLKKWCWWREEGRPRNAYFFIWSDRQFKKV